MTFSRALTDTTLALVAGMTLLLHAGCDSEGDDDDDDDSAEDYFAPDEPGPYAAGTDRYEAVGPGAIELPVQVWFPTTADLDDPYVYDDLLEGGAIDGASPACDEPRPVVMFSHGNSGIRYQSFTVMEHFVTHGIVTVAPDHTNNTFLDMDDDQCSAVAMRRPLDIAAAHDWLLEQAADSGSPLSGCADPAAGYAMMGHSFGGFTTYATSGAAHPPFRTSR